MIKLTKFLFPILLVVLFSACANQAVNSNSDSAVKSGSAVKSVDSEKFMPGAIELRVPPSYENFKSQPGFEARYKTVDNISSRAKNFGYSKGQSLSLYQAKSNLSDLYREAAKTDFSEAQYLYAYGLYKGIFALEKDYGGAFFWAQKAVKKDNSFAMSLLGDIYQFSPKHKDLEKSFFWRNKASEYGSSEAIHNLGLMYQQGLGVTKDMEKAFLLYNLSVASGYAPAKKTLGLWYILNGEITKGTELVNAPKIKKTFIGAKPQEILIWSKKLAETEDPIFMYRYALSLGKHKQYEDAISWAKKSADSGVASAMHFLGLIYYSTTNFKDLNLAREYFQKANDLDYPRAKTRLGNLYFNGEGVEKNHQIAFDLYIDAIETGHVDQNITARRNLGSMFNKYGTTLYHKELSLQLLKDSLVLLKRRKAQKK